MISAFVLKLDLWTHASRCKWCCSKIYKIRWTNRMPCSLNNQVIKHLHSQKRSQLFIMWSVTLFVFCPSVPTSSADSTPKRELKEYKEPLTKVSSSRGPQQKRQKTSHQSPEPYKKQKNKISKYVASEKDMHSRLAPLDSVSDPEVMYWARPEPYTS